VIVVCGPYADDARINCGFRQKEQAMTGRSGPSDDIWIDQDAGNAVETLWEAGWLFFDLGGAPAGPACQINPDQ
jgi:hypothetical protein